LLADDVEWGGRRRRRFRAKHARASKCRNAYGKTLLKILEWFAGTRESCGRHRSGCRGSEIHLRRRSRLEATL